jgi:hypothetical protein
MVKEKYFPDTLQADFERGVSLTGLARKYSSTIDTVKKHLIKRGYNRFKKVGQKLVCESYQLPEEKEIVKTVSRLFEEGNTIYDMKKALGIQTLELASHLHMAGVIRPRDTIGVSSEELNEIVESVRTARRIKREWKEFDGK